MTLMELFDRAIQGYQDEPEDNTIPKIQDIRKTKLTIADIAKLRLLRDVRDYEQKIKLADIRRQYGAKPADQMSAPM